jgi:signal peptidase I
MENNINSQIDKNVPIKKSKLREHAENAWDLIKFAALALIIVLPIRMFIAQPFIVSGESMVPTFQDGQYLIVDEISYILNGEHRGDVVVFKYPNDTKRYFIKRVIGMPNEKIIITDGKIKIINKENPD